MISPSFVGLYTWNTTLQIKVVLFLDLDCIGHYELSFSNSIQVWKGKWWPDYSFKLFQSLLVFSNIQSFVKLMGKNNWVGGFSFFSNPSIFLLLPCMTLPEMDAKARQQCNDWWVEQNCSAVWLCVCVCAGKCVCGHLWRNCEADGTVSLSSMHSWAPEASCRHLLYCSSVHKCCTPSNIVLTQSHPP